MMLTKLVSLSSEKDGYIHIESLREAKRLAKENIKKGIETSVYVDWFRGEERTDPIKSIAYFTDDACKKLYKSNT